jgi:hypothetical protein
LEQNGKPFVVISGTADERLNKAVTVLENLERAKRLGSSSHDFVQIYQHGMSISTIETELNHFKSGIPKAIIDRPGVVGDGITKLSDEELSEYAALFDLKKTALKLEKFVPASGAASRMFKFLNEFLNDFDGDFRALFRR